MDRPAEAGQAAPKADAELGPVGVIETRLGYVLHRANLLQMEILRGLLGEVGLTPPRATAIAFISNNPGVDQSTLARALGINRASAMEFVNTLETLGAVQRKRGRDRRSNALHLTAKGARLHARFLEASAECDGFIAADLTSQESEQLGALLRRVRTSLDRHLSTAEINENQGENRNGKN